MWSAGPGIWWIEDAQSKGCIMLLGIWARLLYIEMHLDLEQRRAVDMS